jgi:hypothetical protein
MEERERPAPPEAETLRLAGLPVDALPPDAPDTPSAATDAPAGDRTGAGPDPEGTAHDPAAERGPRALMDPYASALASGDAGLVPDEQRTPQDERQRTGL